MLTIETLRAICPQLSIMRAGEWVSPLEAAMQEFDIDTPSRRAAFLAQIAHESGGFRYVRELWGPTEAQLKYEGRADLGNTETGDGVRFRGRGLIQITGRANFEKCGEALGLDLITWPEELETPVNAARSAGWFWKEHGLNALADADDFRGITRRINGGYNGLQERLALWERAKKAGVTA